MFLVQASSVIQNLIDQREQDIKLLTTKYEGDLCLYREFLIGKNLLFFEQEIIRHSLLEKLGFHHFLFRDIEDQRRYIGGCQEAYKRFRKEIKNIMGDKFSSSYKEEKKAHNKRILKYLQDNDWTQEDGISRYLPFFYSDGRFKELEKEQYAYKYNLKKDPRFKHE